MGFLTKDDKKVLKAQDKINEEKRKRIMECRQEIDDILERYNCNLRINHQIIVVPK